MVVMLTYNRPAMLYGNSKIYFRESFTVQHCYTLLQRMYDRSGLNSII